jgi:magnesium transporter
MPTALQTEFLAHTVVGHARKDFTTLNQTLTVGEAVEVIRKGAGGGGVAIQYFYVVNDVGKLVGVLPLRRLITFPVDKPLKEVMHARVIALPTTATVLDACEFFVLHKLLAFPVVNEARQVVGVIDVSQFTTDMIDLGGGEPPDDVFEALGFRVSQARGASPLKAFRFRFPWLTATITSGFGCALLTSVFEVTLAKSIVLAFFLTLVLGLAESVSVQSLTLAIQTLRGVRPTLRWYSRAVWREIGTAFPLGLACGLVVAVVVWAWRGDPRAALVVGGGIGGAILGACFFGLSVPAGLHALKLDPKIAAGPMTLALTDVWTLVVYFGLASMVL